MAKRHKVFLEQQQCLDLATSIADTQERKAVDKSEKRKATLSSQAGAPKNASCPKKSRRRLKEVKAMLVSQKAKAKKDKARSKRETHHRGVNSDAILSPAAQDAQPPKKSVSFA